MKKSSSVLFVLLLAVCGMTGAFAQSENDFKVTTADGKVTITGYTGSAAAVVIPAKIRGTPVTDIGEAAFEYCGGLTSVSIPPGITTIGDSAFYECTGLTTVSIPAGLIRIGSHAFEYCKGLTSVSIPPGLTGIGKSAFFGCTGLTSVSIPAGATTIDDDAFRGCIGLASIIIGANVKLSGGSFASFENDFVTYYDTNGKKAGVYTWNGSAWSYKAQ